MCCFESGRDYYSLCYKVYKKCFPFPEFDGAQMSITFHKAWVTACKYVLKEDKEPYNSGKHDPQPRNKEVSIRLLLHKKRKNKKLS